MKTHRLRLHYTSPVLHLANAFTLIEMVLVLGIIALLVGAGIFQLTGVLEGGQNKRVKGDLTTLTSAFRAYEMQNGFLPSTEQGVNALVERPSSRPAPTDWRPMLKRMILDPWGNPYHYRRPGTKDKGGFDIYSAGPDGQAENADDIGNWQL
jgi:general secretion pathway protein G